MWEEASRWDWIRSQENLPPLELARPVPPPPPDAVKPADEGETASFSPCGMWYHTSLPQRIIVMGELPAAAVSRWGEPCPPSWSLAGQLGVGWPNHDSRRKEVEFSIGLCGLIALQWVLIGGFPLIHPRRWYYEPGALITICTFTVFLTGLCRSYGCSGSFCFCGGYSRSAIARWFSLGDSRATLLPSLRAEDVRQKQSENSRTVSTSIPGL